VALHGTNLLVHWLSAILVMQVSRLLQKARASPLKSMLAALLYAVFPFLYRAVPWVTALPHLLVALLNVGTFLLRSRLPGTGTFRPRG
jgi:hypothetical protein